VILFPLSFFSAGSFGSRGFCLFISTKELERTRHCHHKSGSGPNDPLTIVEMTAVNSRIRARMIWSFYSRQSPPMTDLSVRAGILFDDCYIIICSERSASQIVLVETTSDVESVRECPGTLNLYQRGHVLDDPSRRLNMQVVRTCQPLGLPVTITCYRSTHLSSHLVIANGCHIGIQEYQLH